MVHGMETSLYDDDGVGQASIKNLKRNMTLDFNSQPSAKKPKPALLGSPDLKLLQLASPELERLIIQQNGTVTTTPTPTQFIYPKEVTEQQEEYARGFMDALAELHKKQVGGDPSFAEMASTLTPTLSAAIKIENMGRSTPVSSAILAVPKTVNTLPETTAVSRAAVLGSSGVLSQAPTLSTLTTVPSTVIPTTCISQLPPHTAQSTVIHQVSTSSQGFQPQQPMSLPQQPLLHDGVSRLKEEPQTVPCSPPISPIDMESQECIKLERKRERNRVAARKCRTRKLERISRLEERVDDLKGQNQQLSSNAKELRDQVVRLKRQIMEHVSNGCQVMLSQSVL